MKGGQTPEYRWELSASISTKKKKKYEGRRSQTIKNHSTHIQAVEKICFSL